MLSKTDSLQTQVFKDYLELCKPKVIMLMLITTWVGMHLASNTIVPIGTIAYTTIGIGLSAASAAVINHLIDRQIDTKMLRTARRPIADGRVKPGYALSYALCMGVAGTLTLYYLVNPLTSLLTLVSLLGYAVFYTVFLKHATPQNIVIGGIVGATPPLLGWCAVTNSVEPQALLMALIIFTWTPPHFWALAIHRHKEYAKASVPMLPTTHGIEHTKLHTLLYTALLVAVTLLPVAIAMSGLLYFICSSALNIKYMHMTWKFYMNKPGAPSAIKLFQFSIIYLALLFMFLLLDHYLQLYIIHKLI